MCQNVLYILIILYYIHYTVIPNLLIKAQIKYHFNLEFRNYFITRMCVMKRKIVILQKRKQKKNLYFYFDYLQKEKKTNTQCVIYMNKTIVTKTLYCQR